MVAGDPGIDRGPNVPKNVTEEQRQKQESATTLPLIMEGVNVKEAKQKLKNATNILVVRLLSSQLGI